MRLVSRRASKSVPAQASRIALICSGRRIGGGSSGTIGGVIRAMGDSRTSSSDTAHFQNACRQR